MAAASRVEGERALSRFGQISFVVFMLGLTALFVTLGVWQLDRLAEKEALIVNVETRMGEPEAAFPRPSDWPSLEPDALDYRPYRVSGTFDHSQTVLIFHNLTAPQGQYGGVGYWVMAPLYLEGDAVLWVNRGFVPQHLVSNFATGGPAPEGEVTISGIARRPERANPFTPGSEVEERREWVRNPERLSLFLPEDAGPLAPVTLDMEAGEPGALPQGGETEIYFPNRHLEYAGTWFMFAAITPIMLGFWFWRQRKLGRSNRRS